MDARNELEGLGFHRAGAIRPCDFGQSCSAIFENDTVGFIVYAYVVENEIKKFGITEPRLKPRVRQNVSTINAVIALADGRPFVPLDGIVGRSTHSSGWPHR